MQAGGTGKTDSLAWGCRVLLWVLKTRDKGQLLFGGGYGGSGVGGLEEVDSQHKEEASLRFSVQSLGPWVVSTVEFFKSLWTR